MDFSGFSKDVGHLNNEEFNARVGVLESELLDIANESESQDVGCEASRAYRDWGKWYNRSSGQKMDRKLFVRFDALRRLLVDADELFYMASCGNFDKSSSEEAYKRYLGLVNILRSRGSDEFLLNRADFYENIVMELYERM